MKTKEPNWVPLTRELKARDIVRTKITKHDHPHFGEYLYGMSAGGRPHGEEWDVYVMGYVFDWDLIALARDDPYEAHLPPMRWNLNDIDEVLDDSC
jgi:hypothetical protein